MFLLTYYKVYTTPDNFCRSYNFSDLRTPLVIPNVKGSLQLQLANIELNNIKPQTIPKNHTNYSLKMPRFQNHLLRPSNKTCESLNYK